MNPNSKSRPFNTITGEDWKRNLPLARARRKGTKERILKQMKKKVVIHWEIEFDPNLDPEVFDLSDQQMIAVAKEVFYQEDLDDNSIYVEICE